MTYLGGGSLCRHGDGSTTQEGPALYFSHDYGRTWPEQVPLPTTPNGKIWSSEGNGLVDRDAESGRVTRLWGTGKKPGLACLYRCSEDAGRTWGPCRHVPQWGCTGEIVLHRAGNGNIIAACRTMLPQFEGKIDHHSGLGISVSEDNGQTWSELDVLYAWGRHMSSMVTLANGDARVALNAMELVTSAATPDEDGVRRISQATIEDAMQRRALLYDKAGDQHYDTISAFIKSIRGSDPDAALYWFAKMLHAGEDPRFIARRLVISASEDIGLADSNALRLALSAQQAFELVVQNYPEDNMASLAQQWLDRLSQ